MFRLPKAISNFEKKGLLQIKLDNNKSISMLSYYTLVMGMNSIKIKVLRITTSRTLFDVGVIH